MTGQLVPGNIPIMVRAAHIAAQRLGFENSCTDEVGQLLQVLANQFQGETIGEIGAGVGVGSAWIASGLSGDSRLITIDHNPEAVEATRTQFLDHASIDVLEGDWREILNLGPFAMLFVDVNEAKNRHVNEIVDALRVGGLAIIDDLTPYEHWPEEEKDTPDPLREQWLENPRLLAVEVMVTAMSSVILATRRR